MKGETVTGSKKILIVEDYADIAQIYSIILKKAGYDVQVAKDGKSALEGVKTYRPDLILLDIMIPDIDGLTVLRTIRSNPEYADIHPLVLITTNVLQQDISDKAAANGADGYILKARLDNKELVTIVNDLFAKQTGGNASDSVGTQEPTTTV